MEKFLEGFKSFFKLEINECEKFIVGYVLAVLFVIFTTLYMTVFFIDIYIGGL